MFRYKFWPTAVLATLSYSIYLSHKVINHLVNTRLMHVFELENHQLFPISMVGALICGLVLHLIIEKPFLTLRDNIKI